MRVALGQYAVAPTWQENLAVCGRFVRQCVSRGANLLVLPEGVLARAIDDPGLVRRAAQPLDGDYVQGVRDLTRDNSLTVVAVVHVPSDGGMVRNTSIVVRGGDLVATYQKLHLYDAFNARESRAVVPGDEVPRLVEVDGWRVGLMTCYDVRFPEAARRLALDGADLLVLPAAWVRGPMKEHHWSVNVTARALENTVYVAAVGECGPRNIGRSMVIDPLGVTLAGAGESEELLFADLSPERLAYARETLPVLKNRRYSDPVLRPAPTGADAAPHAARNHGHVWAVRA
ncbi:deaminated glutathione amidase [Micromonospora sp. B11E3]|uniref:deaminated glutathione amidase n=1 Tax=Micromonospora sp. B11E3 TaxID=3153562 RepID=UPI00325E6C1C